MDGGELHLRPRGHDGPLRMPPRPVRCSRVRRCLFGREGAAEDVNGVSNSAWLTDAQKRANEGARERWAFDFELDVPVTAASNWTWQPVAGNAVPSFYHPRCLSSRRSPSRDQPATSPASAVMSAAAATPVKCSSDGTAASATCCPSSDLSLLSSAGSRARADTPKSVKPCHMTLRSAAANTAPAVDDRRASDTPAVSPPCSSSSTVKCGRTPSTRKRPAAQKAGSRVNLLHFFPVEKKRPQLEKKGETLKPASDSTSKMQLRSSHVHSQK